MKRGAFFCQHMWGVGHLYRSLRICQALVKEYAIDFIQGGERCEGATLASPHFHHHYLTPLHDRQRLLKKEDPELLAIAAARRQEMEKIVSRPFDFVIIEHFPLGRQFLTHELLWMIEEVKKRNPRAPLLSVHRGVARSGKEEALTSYDQRGFSLLQRYFDRLLVLTDPKMIRLEENMEVPEEVKKKILYTGFVVDSNPLPKRGHFKKEVIVSTGSGYHGEAFVHSLLKSVKEFPDYTFRFFVGSALKEAVMASENASNAIVEPFTQTFTKVLYESALMIGNGGNSIVDAAYTKTPSLIYPLAEGMTQLFVSKKFADWGYVRLLEKEPFTEEIRKMLNGDVPVIKGPLDFGGAQQVLNSVRDLI